ncbi:hypothetical protein PCH_Pc06g00330 [Penicillium rubens Wisconsin 54-1255]|uniref:Uncharacterized protein n=1 Tax=Penicillium rubens (strain ATCC 28089 / DSM 1075 / NRRL 1951 / Wisconsin 54-1255) TaxID=500485 RepID=B6GVX8_PENRW|nr:hypothetical protein PCH_Pc06g00330 [Penicillium rubens Wisconsin 54-1255]
MGAPFKDPQDNRETGDNHFDHFDPPSKPPANNDIHQPERGGLRLQDNRLTSDNQFEYPAPCLVDEPLRSYPPRNPPRTSISTSLTVAGFITSGQSGDSLTVAGFGFRTIGRLLQDNRLTSDDQFDNSPRNPPQSTTLTSLTVAGFGFRTIGRLLQGDRETSDNNFEYPPQSTTSINNIHQSDCGRLHSFRTISRLVITSFINNDDQHPRSITSTSLTVAGFIASGQSGDWLHSFRTISRLVITSFINNDDQHPQSATFTSLTVAGFGFRQTADDYFNH